MIGAIIGDIAGSRFEFHNHRSKDFTLLAPSCRATDDSVMSLAVAAAILDADGDLQKLPAAAVARMQQIGRHYPDCGYGGNFGRWVFSDRPRPYHSYGNGAAMRVSACGFAARSHAQALVLADAVTAVTHDHPEGLRGARATAAAIWLARSGASLAQIRAHIAAEYYPLDFTIDGIRAGYRFDESCQNTVPQALEAFLESTSFEDAIRTAVSLGGDSDTLAAIAGGPAEAFWGVPDALRAQALPFLDARLSGLLAAFEQRYPPQPPQGR